MQEIISENNVPIPEHEPPRGFISRLNRWSRRPGGLLTLEFAGMAAAAALGFAIAQRAASSEELHAAAPVPPNAQVTRLKKQLAERDARLAAWAQEKKQTEEEAGRLEIEREMAAADADAVRQQNDQMRKAVAIFRDTRKIVLPPAPAPLPIRVPKATVVAIKQGAKEGVVPDGQGGFVVVRRPSPNVTEALKNGLQKPAQIAALAPPHAGQAMELQAPIDTYVRPGTVTLRWVKAPTATSYTVQLLDEKGADVLGKDGEEITGTGTPFGIEWTTPRPLGAGVYRWQVTANMPEGVVPRTLLAGGRPAGFGVLDAARMAEIKSAEAQFAGNALELGVRYARAGLLDDAESALIPFVAAYPDSPQTKRLLEQIRGWRLFRTSGHS